jgi:hypothetical protein
MIDFEFVEIAGDDLWSDHESEVVSEQIARFTAVEWHAFATELASRGPIVQERVAQILGDLDVEPAADVLLPLAASENREVALTAREALRGMSLPVVVASAKRIASEGHLVATKLIEYKSINEILDAIEAKPVRPGAA